MKFPTPDRARLQRRIDHLASLVDPGQVPYTRRAFSKEYQQARSWLAGEFEAVGLRVSTDEAGNLIGLVVV